MGEKESLECGRMNIWALKTEKLPGPLSRPWTPAADSLLNLHNSALLCCEIYIFLFFWNCNFTFQCFFDWLYCAVAEYDVHWSSLELGQKDGLPTNFLDTEGYLDLPVLTRHFPSLVSFLNFWTLDWSF